MKLGNILEEDGGEEEEKGPDMYHTAQVPSYALGEPFALDLPDSFEVEGRVIIRAQSPHEEPGKLSLNLSEGLKSGQTIRLRRQGGEAPSEAGRPGDLYLTLEVFQAERPAKPAPKASSYWPAVAAAIAAVAAIAAAFASG